MVAFKDETSGRTFAFTDDSDDSGGGIFGTGVELSDILGAAAEGVSTGGILDVDFGQGETARETGEDFGDWLEDFTGMGGGGSQQPDQGSIGLPQIPGGGGGGGGGIGLPQIPGGGGGMGGPQFAGGGAGNVDMGGVIGQVGMRLVQYLSSNPRLLQFVAQKLGLSKRKGHPSHVDYEHGKCVSKLVEYLPARRREALEQYLCGLKGPIGTADQQTFMICILANMASSDVVADACNCD